MSIDLFVPPGGRRTSAELYGQVRESISTGRLRPGDRLPTTRALAAELGVARSTVTAVYARLLAEGVTEARTGDGTFVAGSQSSQRRARRAGTALAPRRRSPGTRHRSRSTPVMSTSAPAGPTRRCSRPPTGADVSSPRCTRRHRATAMRPDCPRSGRRSPRGWRARAG